MDNEQSVGIIDGMSYQSGILGAARAWLSDCKNQHTNVLDGHTRLLLDLHVMFLGGSEEEIAWITERLRLDGFEIGYDKVGNVTTISYPANAFRISYVDTSTYLKEDDQKPMVPETI